MIGVTGVVEEKREGGCLDSSSLYESERDPRSSVERSTDTELINGTLFEHRGTIQDERDNLSHAAQRPDRLPRVDYRSKGLELPLEMNGV